jgi:hypothetical protein
MVKSLGKQHLSKKGAEMHLLIICVNTVRFRSIINEEQYTSILDFTL